MDGRLDPLRTEAKEFFKGFAVGFEAVFGELGEDMEGSGDFVFGEEGEESEGHLGVIEGGVSGADEGDGAMAVFGIGGRNDGGVRDVWKGEERLFDLFWLDVFSSGDELPIFSAENGELLVREAAEIIGGKPFGWFL